MPKLRMTIDGSLVILSWNSLSEATHYKLLFASGHGTTDGYSELEVGNKTSIALDFDDADTLNIFESKGFFGNLREGLAFYVAVQPHTGERAIGLSNLEYAILGGRDRARPIDRKTLLAYSAKGTKAPLTGFLGVSPEALTLPVREANPCTGLSIPCVDQYTLCLNRGRFRVTAEWKNYNDNSTGRGVAVHLSSDSGYFWFFSDTNIELVVKVIDGCPVNGNFWVLYGALSDVEYHIRVVDTATGRVKTYDNPAHHLGSNIDITAFTGACQAAPEGPQAQAGYWQGPGVEFYVAPDSQSVRNFVGMANLCGYNGLRYASSLPIANGSFSFSQSGFSFTGTFTSSQAANGSWGLNNYSFQNGCVSSYGPASWSAQWINSSQPAAASEVSRGTFDETR